MSAPHDAILLAALRMQAWERAKGELRAMLRASHSDPSCSTKQSLDDHYKRFVEINNTVEDFINNFEGEGFHE